MYRRAAIERVGGYDETYQRAEDWEMNHRIRLAGGLIWFQPELRVTYRPRASIRTLGAQYFHYGRWRRVVARQHAGTINPRYLAPPLAVLAMAAGIVIGLAGLAAGGSLRWLAVGFVIPVGYLAGVLAVTMTAARSLTRPVLARLPAALVTMHVCWGVGFLTSPRSLVPGARDVCAIRLRLRPGSLAVSSAEYPQPVSQVIAGGNDGRGYHLGHQVMQPRCRQAGDQRRRSRHSSRRSAGDSGRPDCRRRPCYRTPRTG